MSQDDQLVVVARTSGAYGVRGWIRITPIESGEGLLATKNWWFIDRSGQSRALELVEFKAHGTLLLAKFKGCESKESADQMRGQIAVLHSDLPETDEQEHWAVDILGAQVINRQGVALGVVTDLGDNGVQDILKVQTQPQDAQPVLTYLIPMVDQYIDEIDDQNHVITVDWQPDWT